MKAIKGLTRWRRRCLRLGLLAWLALPGCVFWEEHGCKDIPKGAIPPCNGTHAQEIFRTQAEIAEADDFVIYEHEWLYDPLTGCGTIKPGPYGTYHMNQIVKRLPDVPFPVLIQVNPLDEKLNEARRMVVVTILKANGICDAETRVILGFPEAEGLFGEEAACIFRKGYSCRGITTPYGYGGYGGYGSYGGYGGYGAYGSFGGLSGYGSIGGFGGLGGLRRF
jgi:hypothetical protein